MNDSKDKADETNNPQPKKDDHATKRLCGRFTQRQVNIIKLAPALAGVLIEDFITQAVTSSEDYKELAKAYDAFRLNKKKS